MAGITIPFLAKVSQFLRGKDDVERGFDDVADSLDDLARESQRSTRRVSDDLSDTGKDARTAADRIEKSYREAFESTRSASKTATTDLGGDARRSMKEAGDATDTFAKEAKSNLSETVSSFRGDAEDIPQIFQDVFGGVVADLGPAGLIGGALAAAGIGLAVSLFQKSAQEAAELKQKVIDLANEIDDANGRVEGIDWAAKFRDFGNEIADAKSWFEPWQKEARTNFEVIRDETERLGLSFAQVFQGLAGDTDQGASALATIRTRLSATRTEMDKYNQTVGTGVEWTGRSYSEILTQIQGLERLEGQLEKAGAQTDAAVGLQSDMADAYGETAAAVERANDAIREQADLTKEQTASELDYLDAIDSATEALGKSASDGFDKSTQAGRDNLRQLAQVADATRDYAQAVQDSTGSTEDANAVIYRGRAQIMALGRELGMTTAEAQAYATQLGLVPGRVATDVEVNDSSARAKLDALGNPVRVPVVPDWDAFDRAVSRKRPVINGSVRFGRVIV